MKVNVQVSNSETKQNESINRSITEHSRRESLQGNGITLPSKGERGTLYFPSIWNTQIVPFRTKWLSFWLGRMAREIKSDPLNLDNEEREWKGNTSETVQAKTASFLILYLAEYAKSPQYRTPKSETNQHPQIKSPSPWWAALPMPVRGERRRGRWGKDRGKWPMLHASQGQA